MKDPYERSAAEHAWWAVGQDRLMSELSGHGLRAGATGPAGPGLWCVTEAPV
ncbi:hypothetical protein [Nonomuraea diastatica]|uniref:hypothetical protein n=1 Tax=Nonomuraea diastatica TaxID=1848329 RepID=UPI00140B7159|nr:hypothetical protein [Nonomuraea diastatica]